MAPPSGEKITLQNGKLNVPDNPIIPFIEGDGTGRDIWRASQARVRRRGREGLRRQEEDRLARGLAGEKAFKQRQQLAARRDRRRRSASTSSASRAR